MHAIYFDDSEWKFIKSTMVEKSRSVILLHEENEIPIADDDIADLQRKIKDDFWKLNCFEKSQRISNATMNQQRLEIGM